MITYIIQVVLFQILFLAVYDFFLSKETFYKYNRWYLLGTPIVSFVLPLIKIPTFQKAVPQEIMILLPEVMLSPQKILEQTTFYTDGSINYISILFWIGVALFTTLFLFKLFKIIQLIVKNEIIQKHFYKLVLLPKQLHAFSFFNYIFLGKNIPIEEQKTIIKHELVHAKQKHSLDLLFFEFLRIVMWFNPIIYFYQHRITLLHEYISDAEIIKNTKKHDYFNTLLSQTFEVENISFVNQFYKHSFIKKRITMMTKNKSKQIKKAKYLLLLPLLASMLIYTSCEKNDVEELQIISKKQLQTTYMDLLSNKEIRKGEKETYLDAYIGTGLPKGVEIEYEDLTNEEKEEYDVYYKKFKAITKSKNRASNFLSIKLFRNENNRGIIATVVNLFKEENNIKGTDYIEKNNEDVPFAIIENVPVFPGCKGTRKEKADCLNKKIQKFVVKNFNTGASKNLGLSSGRKKIWLTFKIDKNGDIVDVNARAPHPILKEEAIRVIGLLPKMVPGKQKGKAVSMKYTMPISFNVE
tara:strand:+ start:1512 stop:3083 length:1572 start_codon:yes stop_codon:yes gene_type:complete